MEMTKAQRDTYDTLLRLLREHGVEDLGEDGVDHAIDGKEYPYIDFIDQYIDDREWRFRIEEDGAVGCFCSVPENRLSPADLEGDAAAFKWVIEKITKEW